MIIHNNKLINKLLFFYRKHFCDKRDHIGLGYDKYVDYKDQKANDYVYKMLSTGKPLMISKFGTIELSNIVSRYIERNLGVNNVEVLHDFLHYDNVCIDTKGALKGLCNNAGFFPYDMNLANKWYELMLNDIKEVDILGSYVYEEKYLASFMHCKRVNIDGYFAPYKYKRPWTRILENKKILVVHPFVDSIKKQYENNRTCLFEDKDVLPQFKELILIKAVQTMADANDSRFKDWFEALEYMKKEIDACDYDIALIGCGAYGMCLAAHVKRMGKQAIHLASMTQMLFGIYGRRWLVMEPEYKNFINSYWIKPNDKEKPKGADKVENGCYW